MGKKIEQNEFEMLQDILGRRGGDYGPADQDFECSAQIFNSLIKRINGPIQPRHIPLFQIAIKLSREAYKHGKDNVIDIMGYAHLIERTTIPF